MSSDFLHGVRIIELSNGIQPVRTVKSAVIGIIGTATALAAADAFPLNKPVLIAGSRKEAAKLGTEGTLPQAVEAILKQAGAAIVVVRVENEAGVTDGAQALVDSDSVLGVTPRILLAPGFTSKKPVADELLSVANRLRAIVLIDAPNTDDAEAIDYAKNFGSDRAYVIDPAVRVADAAGAEGVYPVSSYVAGIIAKTDHDKGFWWSPSNKEIFGIIGTTRPVDFLNGDENSRANLLNEKNINTVIRQNGFRLWGNRTCATDKRFAFLCVRRTADMINDSVQAAILHFVDQPVTKQLFESIADTVNEYLRSLVAMGAILGGECWYDRDDNANGEIMQGKIRFRYKFTPPPPAEDIGLYSAVVEEYYDAIFS